MVLTVDPEARLLIDRRAGEDAVPWQEAGEGELRVFWSGALVNLGVLSRGLGLSEEAREGEVLTELWRRHGSAAAERLAGHCSFVVWDAGRQSLFAARDRAGTRALYFHPGPPFRLATEPGFLLDRFACGPTPDLETLRLRLAGAPPPLDRTAYAGLRQIEPGAWLRCGPQGLDSGSYWRPELRPVERSGDAGAPVARLRDLLETLAEDYLGGEVRAGLTLSSGLDSTSIAAAAHARGKPAVALRWTTPELPRADESAGQLAVCRRLGFEEVEVRADRHWPLRHGTAGLVSPADPPVTAYREVWTETFRRAAETGLTAVCTGSYGDLLFGGDVLSYPDLLLTLRWRRLARELRLHRERHGTSPARLLRRFLLVPIRDAYLPRLSRRRPPAWVLDPPSVRPAPCFGHLPARGTLLRQLAYPYEPLVLAELQRLAAPFGIDLRHPYHDHRLVEFVLALPPEELHRAGRQKDVLIRAGAGRLPPEVLDARRKILPTPIFERGVREREAARVWALLSDTRLEALGLVDGGRLREDYRGYLAGEHSDTRFWLAAGVEAWLRAVFP